MLVKIKRTKKQRSDTDENFELYESRKENSKQRSNSRNNARKGKYDLQSGYYS